MDSIFIGVLMVVVEPSDKVHVPNLKLTRLRFQAVNGSAEAKKELMEHIKEKSTWKRLLYGEVRGWLIQGE